MNALDQKVAELHQIHAEMATVQKRFARALKQTLDLLPQTKETRAALATLDQIGKTGQ